VKLVPLGTVVMPTDDDAAGGRISGNYCICERGGTLGNVDKKELGRITATQTVEMKASLEVLQREIEETLDRKN